MLWLSKIHGLVWSGLKFYETDIIWFGSNFYIKPNETVIEHP